MQTSNIWIAWRDDPRSARHRLHRGAGGLVFQIVPWLNVLVIAALFLVLSQRVMIAPGVVFRLPQGTFEEGIPDSCSAVMVAPVPGGPTLAFFDDARYRIDDEGERALLEKAIYSSRVAREWKGIVLYAAEDVPHGDVMRFVGAARGAGAEIVNVATDPPRGDSRREGAARAGR